MTENIVADFACDVFGEQAMRRHLSPRVADAVAATAARAAPIPPDIADEVANGMKRWAMDKGATHYTHWFQPLTGATAEKHEAFLMPDPAKRNGGVIAQFSGKELIQGEPDASSFPSGGVRSTFEARGYTAWDPTSPAFVVNAHSGTAVLCIPCFFCGYHGEALDGKTPLLRSQAALAKQLLRVAKIFEIEGNERPYATLGLEQEYFLVDSALFAARPDLVMTGRTLFGNRPARHQQMEDHYYGRIKPRVLAFMAEVDRRLWRLGVPAKTRHNEVSPGQFELAPVFEEQNLSVDHNMLVMHTLQDAAGEFGFACLLHEKPFAGVNGSGKHNNWSLVGTDGQNWFAPGKTPHDNAKFLFLLVAVITAVDTHAPLIRSCVATAGNDHRLGANEAPPAIMSICLGEQLDEIIGSIDAGRSLRKRNGDSGRLLEIGVDALPEIPRDVSDRNRTSPFAFTGNKFEFRAVGSSQSCADANTVLNTVMAAALDGMCGEMERSLADNPPRKNENGHSDEFHNALNAVLRSRVRAHGRVVFSGNGYSPEWQEEAARRGLPNLRTTREALPAMASPEAVALYTRYGVLSEREAASRHEVYRHAWETTVAMEGGCALDMARRGIAPAALRFEAELAASAERSRSMGRDAAGRVRKYEQAADLIDRLYAAMDALETALRTDPGETVEKMAVLRAIVDRLESIAPADGWPYPGYAEMFFNSCQERNTACSEFSAAPTRRT